MLIALAFLLAPFIVVLGASFDTAAAATGVSVLVGISVAILATLVGTAAAFGLVRGRVIGRGALQAFFHLPVQIPFVVTGAVFLQFYYQLGPLLGINLLHGVTGLIIAHLFVAIPYSVGAVSAVLARFDATLEEAAESLGATRWGIFLQITLPVISPGVMAGAFYAFIVSFGDVPVALFLVTGQWTTLPVLIFQDMQFDFRSSMLAASSLIAVVSLLVIFGVQKLAGFDAISTGQGGKS
jgi:putative spermidine/putrescine transport system permease protein